MGNAPPTSTSRPPNVVHVIGVPRPSPFFCALPLSCIILNASQGTKKTGRPGNEASNYIQRDEVAGVGRVNAALSGECLL